MHKHIYSQTQRKIMKEDREKRKLTESDGELNQKFTSVLSSKEECETLTECNSDVSEANRMSFCDLNPMSPENSTCNLSPWNQTQPSPYLSAPWPDSSAGANPFSDENFPQNGLISCLVREEGHIYSLAAKGDLLYTGSDSKNIRVWKNQKEYSVFKSNSGLVKAIVISGEKIFTGHQDGKIRVWRVSAKKSTQYKRLATLPTRNDFLRSSFKPSNYIKVGRHRNTLWLKHVDAISCLSLDEELGLLYSGSWDKTLKVWRISDSKCLESITAHDDAVNAVVAAFDSLIFTGSADGTVKVWRRELLGTGTKHFFQQSLLKQECAVTALTVNLTDCVVYCGSSDGKINLWERDKMLSHSGILSGHKQAVLCLATTTRGLLFSGSADKMIYVWKRENGVHTCMSILSGHMGPVKCLAVEEDPTVSGDGNGDRRWIVYSGSLDKSVKMWQVSEQAMEGELARRRQAT